MTKTTLREKVHQDGYPKKNQPNFEQCLQINISWRFGEFSGTHAGKGVPRLEQRRDDLLSVAYHHRYGHRFAQSASQPKNHGAEQPFLCIAQHRNAGCLPASRAETVGGLSLQIRHTAQNLARDRSDDGENHDRDDYSAGQHAWPVDWPAEERGPTEEAFEPREGIIVQPQNHK